MSKQNDATARRKARVHRAIKAVANGRARLSVHRTGKQIYAQVIDDAHGRTLAAASSLKPELVADLVLDAGDVQGQLAGQAGDLVAAALAAIAWRRRRRAGHAAGRSVVQLGDVAHRQPVAHAFLPRQQGRLAGGFGARGVFGRR